MEDINNLEKDFRKNQQHDCNEMNFLRQQASNLQVEKVRLKQNSVMVDNRVRFCEGEVGFE